MKLESTSFADGSRIPSRFAFATHDQDTRARLSDNVSPHLKWVFCPPTAQRSFALICHDPDAPSDGSYVNQPDREVPSDLERTDFFHWVLVDIPPHVRELAEGSFCDGVVAGGKDAPAGPWGTRQGINDYTGWFAGDDDMAGAYYGYDGPAPPWNDSIEHRYVFTVYALDTESVDVGADFTGPEVLEAIEGHVVAETAITGTYTQNPRLL